MKAPGFWKKKGIVSSLLAPLGWMWGIGAACRTRFATAPVTVGIPVICIGNLVAGGAGKTPLALALGSRIKNAHFLTRGYGGWEKGPLRVDRSRHDYHQVGDEALLLAEVAPTWVAKDRVSGARAAVDAGARCLIMDDGLQNPSLAKTLSLLVVDGPAGFGNEQCLPAGPLREPLSQALKRIHGVVIVGEDRHRIAPRVSPCPVLKAHLIPETESETLRNQRVVAFAGIGRPAKFFHTLERLGAQIVKTYTFPDHHPYQPQEIAQLQAISERYSATLLTTTKDLMRVPPHQRHLMGVLHVDLTWNDETILTRLIKSVVGDLWLG